MAASQPTALPFSVESHCCIVALDGSILMLIPIAASAADEIAVPHVVLGIHGGVGAKKREMTPQLEQLVRAGLELALRAGYARLQEPGATSLDAVEAAIRALEDDPAFNAG